MLAILTGLTFVVWGVQLLGLIAVSNVLLGLLALITGIAWLLSGWVALPTVRRS